MDVVRQAPPMVLTMLKMALVICIPLVLLIGTYDLKTAVTVSCVQFALFFVGFLVPARALDRQHDPGRALRPGFGGQAARQLRSIDRPEQRVWRHAAELRHGDDVYRAADVLDGFGGRACAREISQGLSTPPSDAKGCWGAWRW